MNSLRTLRIALIAAALAAGGCDGSSAGAAGGPAGADGLPRAGGPTAGLLRKMLDAPTHTAYVGMRRVEQAWMVGSARYETVYLERAASDGQGHYSFDTLQLIAPTVSAYEMGLWLLMQKAREGFLFRYRDFAIRDLEQFQLNYSLQPIGPMVRVARRDCDQIVVKRRQSAPIIYTIAVDHETGLILRCEQRDASGRLLGTVAFDSIDYEPDFPAGTAWHVPSNDEEPLVLGPGAAQVLGFPPRLPMTDGDLFHVIESTVVTSLDPAGQGKLRWAKVVLTDGVEVAIFLDGGPDPSAVREDVMRIAPSVGPWNHVEGTLHGERLMAIGRVSHDELLDLMQSTF